jgi:hypothetical protein
VKLTQLVVDQKNLARRHKRVCFITDKSQFGFRITAYLVRRGAAPEPCCRPRRCVEQVITDLSAASTTVVILVAILVAVTEVSRPAAVRMVIVVHPTVVSIPVTSKELLSVMMRLYPTSALVWGTAPITGMPSILPSRRVPIAVYPNEIGSWSLRLNSNHAGSGWWADSDSNGNLCRECRPCGQQHCNKQRCSETLHLVLPLFLDGRHQAAMSFSFRTIRMTSRRTQCCLFMDSCGPNLDARNKRGNLSIRCNSAQYWSLQSVILRASAINQGDSK